MSYIHDILPKISASENEEFESRFNRLNETQEEINKAKNDGLLDAELLGRISKQILIQIVHSSNAIEGNKLSLRETQSVLSSTTKAEKYGKDQTEALSLGAAIEFLEKIVDDNRGLGLTDLFELHHILMKDLVESGAGEVRTHDVTITGSKHNPPSCVLVKQELDNLVRWYNQSHLSPILRACVLHHGLTWIHPFTDGNGRISRLMLNYALAKEGFAPAIITIENRTAYYEALTEADMQEDDAPFDGLVSLIFKSIRESQKVYSREISDKKAASSVKLFKGDSAIEQVARVKSKYSYDFELWLAQMEGFRKALDRIIDRHSVELKENGIAAYLRNDYDEITVDDYLDTIQGNGPKHGKWMFRLVLKNTLTKKVLSLAFQIHLHRPYVRKTVFDQEIYLPTPENDKVALKVNYRDVNVLDGDTKKILAKFNDGYVVDRLELDDEKQVRFIEQRINKAAKGSNWRHKEGTQTQSTKILQVALQYVMSKTG